MSIIRVTVTIKGTRPMLWHRFGPDAIPLERAERTGVPGHDPEEWRKTVSATKDGQLYVDPSYVFGCVRAGGKYIKKGRASIQPAIAATVQVVEDRILIDRWLPDFPNGHACDLKTLPVPSTDPDEPVYLDIRSVVNPATKGRNVRYRIAAAVGWITHFTLQWDSSVVSTGEMQAVLRDAGSLVGIGNGRAIGMGRFEVVSFEPA